MATKKTVAPNLPLYRWEEEAANNDRASTRESPPPEQIKQMLHELRVHQAGLQMQNEELLRTQHELEGMWARYVDLYDQAPVGYVTLDEQGRILEANLTAATMLGTEQSEMIKQPLSHYIIPDDQDIISLYCKKLMEADKVQAFEFRMLQADGSRFWARLETSPGPHKEAKPSVWRAVISDITEQKRAEDRLRETKEMFSQFVRLSPIYTFIKKATPTESCVLLASDNIQQMLGIPGSKLVGKPMADLFPAEIAAKITADDWSVVSSGRMLEREEEFNGRSYTTIKFPVSQGDETLLAGYSFDITEHKKAEEALRVSEARYLSIIEDQTELICRYLPDGRLSFANGAYARYYGKSQAELINKNFIPNIPEPDLSMVISCLAEISPNRPVAAFTHRIIKADREVRWQRWTQRGIYAADGSLLEYQAVGFDITERKLAEMIMQARLRISDYQFDHSLDELLTKVLDEAETLTDSQIGFFHFVDADQVTLSLQTWSSRTLATACTAEGKGHQYLLESAGVWCDCVREKKPVIHNNYESLQHRKGLPAGHIPVSRELVVPIFRNSLIVAVVGVGNKYTDYTNQDIETMLKWGNLAWDTVERKRSEEALRSASIYTRTLLEASLDPLVTISPDGQITDVNEASVRVTGIPREQLIGTDFSAYFTDPEHARKGYLQVFSKGFVHDYPLAIRHASGGITDVLYNAGVYKDEQGRVKGVFAAARDVTDRNRAIEALKQAHDELEARVSERTSALALANEQMKRVSFELVWAEERERERIAGELHDQVGQSLLLAKMKLDALADMISSESLRSCAEEASSLIETSIHDIRSLTFRMRPPILDTAGIGTALEWLCSSVSNDYNLQVDFVSDCQPKSLSAEVHYSLYQAVRELLLNVVKHARAERAQLSVTNDKNFLVVHVADSGAGFNYVEAILRPGNNGGYGLYNVQQRIEQMGGLFVIESTPGRGTSVTLRVPFRQS